MWTISSWKACFFAFSVALNCVRKISVERLLESNDNVNMLLKDILLIFLNNKIETYSQNDVEFYFIFVLLII